MTDSAELDSPQRQRILDAAIAELTNRGIDNFSVDSVAASAGVSPVTVKQIWPNTPDLYSEAILAFAQGHITIPNTGTLRGDVLAYARSYAAAMNSPIGRRIINTVIVSPKDWDVENSRAEFLNRRHTRVYAMLQRGIERGECTADFDPVRFMDLLGGCLSMSMLYYDRLITDEDCREVVDLLLYGIIRKQ